ncbi:MAG: hypothetical protein V4440_08710 [Pseudomonadota bacterium]
MNTETVKVKKPVDNIEKLVFEDPNGYQTRCMFGVWQFRDTPKSEWQLMHELNKKAVAK